MRTTPDPNTCVLEVEMIDREDVLHDMVRVHQDHRPGTRAGQIVVVRSSGRVIRVVARGSKGDRRDVIAMDQKTRERLGVKLGQEAEFTFKLGGIVDEWRWAWTTTDAMPRIAARLAVLSVILGGLGLLLGLISLL